MSAETVASQAAAGDVAREVRVSDVTRALVLAAGRGRRLDAREPKPLYRLLDTPLLVRTLLSLQEAGVEEAVVVVGADADRIRREIDDRDGLELDVRWVRSEHWKRGNGMSALAAAPEFSEPFFLTMADHVFRPEGLERLREAPVRESELALVVDREVDAVEDLPDATKVRLEGEHVAEVGKELTEYDAVDTGLFLATPELFRALRAAWADNGSGQLSLSDGVQRLADAAGVRWVDGTGLLWHDVDTLEDAETAEEKLLDAVRDEQDGPIARRLNRPISQAITRRLLGTPVTPNAVSVAGLVISVAAGMLAALVGYLPNLAAGLLFQLASILDGTDGELAKLTDSASTRGEWVDTVCDNLSYLAFAAGVTVGVHRAGLPDLYLWVGAAGLAATVLSVGNIYASLLRAGESGSARAMRYGYEEGEGFVSRVMQVAHYLGKRDVFSFLLMSLAVVGHLPFGLIIFGSATVLLLLPATTKANLDTWLASREPDAPPGSRREAAPSPPEAEGSSPRVGEVAETMSSPVRLVKRPED